MEIRKSTMTILKDEQTHYNAVYWDVEVKNWSFSIIEFPKKNKFPWEPKKIHIQCFLTYACSRWTNIVVSLQSRKASLPMPG